MKIRKCKHPVGLMTSFSFIAFKATANELIKKFGTPTYNHPEDYGDKVTREWELVLKDGTPLTIYDWKEYRLYSNDEVIEWHVGTCCNVSNPQKQNEKVEKAIRELGFEMVKY